MKALTFTLCLLLTGCSLTWEDKPMPSLFKFVSNGQQVTDAASVSQILHGTSLFPLAPVNLRGHRDQSLNLLIEWTPRSRIGPGLRPNIGVPVAEEKELYQIEIYNGSTLLRTARVTSPSDAMPVLWRNTGAFSSITPAADGTLLQSAVDVSSQLQSIQRLNGDFMLETTVDHTVRIGETQSDGNILIYPVNGTFDNIGYSCDSSALGVDFDWSGAKYSGNLVTGDRIMVELSGLTLKYYVNYAGPQTQPLYTSTRANIPLPLLIQADLIGNSFSSERLDNITKPTIRRVNHCFLYTVDMQTADFGSAQSSITVRVKQISAVVGAGKYVEANL